MATDTQPERAGHVTTAAERTTPDIRDLVVALLPAHTYATPGQRCWTWSTPQGIWKVSLSVGDILSALRLAAGEHLTITLTGPQGVSVDLPRTERGFEALRTLLHVLGAIGPGSAS